MVFPNPHTPITHQQDSRILLNIHALFDQESCIGSWREDGVCCKIPYNHQSLGEVHLLCDISFYILVGDSDFDM